MLLGRNGIQFQGVVVDWKEGGNTLETCLVPVSTVEVKHLPTLALDVQEHVNMCRSM